jgi:hypothetical protein
MPFLDIHRSPRSIGHIRQRRATRWWADATLRAPGIFRNIRNTLGIFWLILLCNYT